MYDDNLQVYGAHRRPHRPGQRDFTAPAPNVLWVADDGQTTWVGHEHDEAPGDALAGTSADRTA